MNGRSITRDFCIPKINQLGWGLQQMDGQRVRVSKNLNIYPSSIYNNYIFMLYCSKQRKIVCEVKTGIFLDMTLFPFFQWRSYDPKKHQTVFFIDEMNAFHLRNIQSTCLLSPNSSTDMFNFCFCYFNFYVFILNFSFFSFLIVLTFIL